MFFHTAAAAAGLAAAFQAAPPFLQFVTLGMLFMVVGLVLDVATGLLAGRIGDVLLGRDWVARLLDRIAGASFAGLALRLVLSDRR